jgi:hypothetical protein
MLKLFNVSNKVFNAANQQERLLTPDYIVGLVDGEGYFSVSPVFGNYESYSSYEVKMVFGIDIKESDGKILKRVKQYFGCGQIYRKKDKRKNFSDMTEYQVKDHFSILNKIIPFFRKYPPQIPSKQRKFKYFTKIGKIVAERKYSTPKGFKKVQELVAKMRQ